MKRVPADEAGLQLAHETLARGGLVAFPTETVYGLGARADDSTAVRRIYHAKGRPWQNPSIVHVATSEAAFALAAEVSPSARALAAAFWPGPLTLILAVRSGSVAPEVTAFGPTLAVRVPEHAVALALLHRCLFPVAAPSANRSGHISPTDPDHVQRSLGDQVDLLLDGGATRVGIESTIVDVTTDPPTMLRPGMVSLAALSELVTVRQRATLAREGDAVMAPGEYQRHYAPTVGLVVVSRQKALELSALPDTFVVMQAASAFAHAHRDVLPDDPAGYANRLYQALHQAEASGADLIVVVEPPTGPSWEAIWDRLRRAAAPAEVFDAEDLVRGSSK